MNMRDAQILNARKKAGARGYYCNLVTQVHFGCEHGNSMLTSELPKVTPRKRVPQERYASRAEQHARYIDCGPGAWDDR